MIQTANASIIPTIDLAIDSPERQAELIKHALGSVGFFAVVNAGPKVEDVAKMFEMSKTFFGLPTARKEEYPVDRSGSGYTKILSQALEEGKRDHKENFLYGKHSANWTQPLPSPFNDDSESQEFIKRFYAECHEVSQDLMELFALALGLSRQHFRQCHSFGLNTALSLIHYPALTMEEEAKLNETDIRAGEHKDWGTLTLLFQQPTGAPGLQAYLPKTIDDPTAPADVYDWYPAPVPQPDGFLVNVGLGMELWSSGMYKATLHRVIFPGTRQAVELQDRYTLAYFVQADDETAFQPILPDGNIDTTSKAITSGELFAMKLQESMERNGKHQAFSGTTSA